jgi:hypothetical protein
MGKSLLRRTSTSRLSAAHALFPGQQTGNQPEKEASGAQAGSRGRMPLSCHCGRGRRFQSSSLRCAGDACELAPGESHCDLVECELRQQEGTNTRSGITSACAGLPQPSENSQGLRWRFNCASASTWKGYRAWGVEPEEVTQR